MTETQKKSWIKNRLPSNAASKFSKLGQSGRSVDSAIDEAYELASGVKEHALADLLEQLAANYEHESESQGEHSYSNTKLLEMAEYWRNRVDADGEPVTSNFRFVDAIFEEPSATDEYSQ